MDVFVKLLPGADACLHINGGCAQVCESKLGSAVCSCLPPDLLAPDGRTCSSADASGVTAGNFPQQQETVPTLEMFILFMLLQHLDTDSPLSAQRPG